MDTGDVTLDVMATDDDVILDVIDIGDIILDVIAIGGEVILDIKDTGDVMTSAEVTLVVLATVCDVIIGLGASVSW